MKATPKKKKKYPQARVYEIDHPEIREEAERRVTSIPQVIHESWQLYKEKKLLELK